MNGQELQPNTKQLRVKCKATGVETLAYQYDGDFIAAIVWAFHGDFRKVVYWIAAGILTLTVTW